MEMTALVRAALRRYATRRVAGAALAGVVACVAGLVWRQQRLGGLELLDSRGWYTPDEAAALFDELDRLDANARLVYASTGLTIDMAFPVAYGLLLAILLFRLFRGGIPLFLLPLAMAAADLLENMTVAGPGAEPCRSTHAARMARRSIHPGQDGPDCRHGGGARSRYAPLALASPAPVTRAIAARTAPLIQAAMRLRALTHVYPTTNPAVVPVAQGPAPPTKPRCFASSQPSIPSQVCQVFHLKVSLRNRRRPAPSRAGTRRDTLIRVP